MGVAVHRIVGWRWYCASSCPSCLQASQPRRMSTSVGQPSLRPRISPARRRRRLPCSWTRFGNGRSFSGPFPRRGPLRASRLPWARRRPSVPSRARACETRRRRHLDRRDIGCGLREAISGWPATTRAASCSAWASCCDGCVWNAAAQSCPPASESLRGRPSPFAGTSSATVRSTTRSTPGLSPCGSNISAISPCSGRTQSSFCRRRPMAGKTARIHRCRCSI